MNRTRRFIISTFYLASVSIILRAVAVSFNAYISSKLGAEGMGLFGLVMSVYGFFVTLACSGISLAATRLSAKVLAVCEESQIKGNLKRLIRSCVCYSLVFGIGSGAVLFFFANPIGGRILSDPRTIPSLRMLALSLPAISLSSALCGYFMGVRRVSKNSAIMIIEQFSKILLTVCALVLISPGGIENACYAVVLGSTLSEFFSLAVAYILYRRDVRGAPPRCDFGERGKRFPAFSAVASIAIPVAQGAYIRQGLVTLEHIAIPWGLRKFGRSSSEALSSYGILHSMALPVVMFPYAVIGAFTSVLLPEIASFMEKGDKKSVSSVSSRVISVTAFFGIGASGVFMTFWYELGISIYSSAQAGEMIRILAPVLPMMFLDTTVDTVLKGLGEEKYCVKVNICDAFSSLLLVLLLVPRMGIFGYIAVIYISEALNACLSISKLVSVSGLKPDTVSFVLVPFLSLGLTGSAYSLISQMLISLWGISLGASGIIVFSLIYIFSGTVMKKLISR